MEKMNRCSSKDDFFVILIKVISFIFFIFVIFAVVGQAYTYLHPSYQEILLQADEKLGWKFAPNIEMTHTGSHWYANEFSVRHKTNSIGFLGPDISFVKPEGVGRVALFGDSFVEALQVSREKSAAGLLEKRLNSMAPSFLGSFNRFEVQNFGISNYGVGQYLIAWEEHASKYSPDYVFILVAGLHMNRTVMRAGDFSPSISRPSFLVVNDELVRHSVVDTEKTNQLINEKIIERGGRLRKRKQKLFVTDWIKSGNLRRSVLNIIPKKVRLAIKMKLTDNPIEPIGSILKERLKNLFSRSRSHHEEISPKRMEISEETLEVNLKIIDELGRKIKESGSQLIVVDVSLYFWFLNSNDILTQRIQEFCLKKNYTYIPLYKDMLDTDRKNEWARWTHDGHFNEHGNAIFAENMLEWVKDGIIVTNE